MLAKAGYEFEGRQCARYFKDGEFIDGTDVRESASASLIVAPYQNHHTGGTPRHYIKT